MHILLGRSASHLIGVLLLWGTISLWPLGPQLTSPSPTVIDHALDGMKSEDWKVRSTAFYRLIRLGSGDLSFLARSLQDLLKRSPERSNQIRIGLIGLLAKENELVQEYLRTGQRTGEDYQNYRGDVIAAVVTLKDIRSMNALLGAISTGWMAVQTLAEFAPASLDPVLAKLSDTDPLVRSSALRVLQEMLSPLNYEKVKQPESRRKIKRGFLNGTRDANAVVRAAAVDGLAALGDPDTIPIVEELAERDPDYLPGQGKGGRNLYYVRNHARKALMQLRSKAKKEH